MNQTIKILKGNNIPVIAITNIGDNTTARLADCVLKICTREKLYSKIATFSTDSAIVYLLDVLYSCIFALDYDANLQLRISTSKMIEVLWQVLHGGYHQGRGSRSEMIKYPSCP